MLPVTPLFIPSPAEGVWHLGPLPLRGYALCIILGIVAAIWIGERRWVARGGRAGRGHGPRALGGAVRPRRRPALPRDHRPRPLLRRGPARRSRRSTSGAAASASGARSRSARVGVVDRRAAQGHPAAAGARRAGARRAGRAGDRAAGATGSTRSCSAGRPTCRGALKIDPAAPAARLRAVRHLPPDVPLRVRLGPRAPSAFVIWADRRFKLGHGRVLALYVMAYTLGRGWIEMLRIDTVRAQRRARPAPQRLDLDRAVRRWPRVYFVVSAGATPAASAGRTSRRGDLSADGRETVRHRPTSVDATRGRRRPGEPDDPRIRRDACPLGNALGSDASPC